MALLKKKDQHRDFFVLDIADVVPKDDTISMEHPFFSLATKPDMRTLHYESADGKVLFVHPSAKGLATIHDKDVLIWAVSKIIHAKNRGEEYDRKVRGSAYDLLKATNRPTNNLGYQRLRDTFLRLRGTTFESDIPTGGKVEKRIFGMVEEAGFLMDWERKRVDEIEIVLSEWMFRAVDALEVVTISPDYFRIRRPLQRRLYEIGRKHCGNAAKWQIDLAKLQKRTGSSAPLKRFRHNVREIIEEDDTPFYKIELRDDDKVVYRPRVTKRRVSDEITLPSWAEEKAREIAGQKGWDYYMLREEWEGFARSGEAPQNPGAAFVGFCKKKKSFR